ncbi:pirin family protein [Thalassovita aquimarina]|uniref:Pirin family protein n=1 Tax=Thalassovita aquimarina TaxID=2785917 RepID=A0ABS5HRX7_9RHOB|nr:pirin family protein [Thalassovita aquimarina]MBR9651680.1 pirin family protein [Thalassovita aquimarina]
MTFRPVAATSQAQPAMEGAGVHLHRVFGFGDPTLTDPFLMMDDFRNDDPRLYSKGFPWHPHRGIETITYVLEGTVEHADSLGNKGVLGPGGVQWMTAGSGIVHQEMPSGDAQGRMHGFQLWANLPSDLKMTTPRYQDITGNDIPVEGEDDGTVVKVIIGSFWGKKGPVDGIAADPMLLDVSVPAGRRKVLKVDTRANALAYVFAGSGTFRDASDPVGIKVEKEFAGQELNIRDQTGNRTLVRFGSGDEITVQAGDEGIRFLLMTGRPIREPVAWHGPIVMNTRAELAKAFEELNNGSFIKHKAAF